MPPVQKSRQFRVHSPLGSDKLLFHHLQGRERLGELFEFELETLSQDKQLEAEKLLGKKVDVEVELRDGGSGWFNGLVVESAFLDVMRYKDEEWAKYRLILRPWLWLLSQAGQFRIFQNLSAPDILKELFKAYPEADFSDQLTASYTKRGYCVQYRQSDLQFAHWLMQEEGIYYYFTHEKGAHRLVLADDYSSHAKSTANPIVPHYPDSGRVLRDEEYFRSWSFTHRIRTAAYTLNDYDYEKPKKKLVSKSKSSLDFGEPSKLEIQDYPGEYVEAKPGEHYAKVRMQQAGAAVHEAWGVGNPRGLQPGQLFKLEHEQRKDQDNAELLVVEAEYDVSGDDYTTSDKQSAGGGGFFERFHDWVMQQHAGRDERDPAPNEPRGFFGRVAKKIQEQFAQGNGQQAQSRGGADEQEPYAVLIRAIDAKRPFKTPFKAPRPLVEGPQTAVVVGKDGEEIWTDELGRVLVKFHWDIRDGSPKFDQRSCWVRVSQPWAHKNWGAFWLPRIGAEVIVEFLEGDPDRPIVTGQVYNGDNKPPIKLPSNATQSTFKSNSSKGGGGFNQLLFEDKKGAEDLQLRAERDMHVNVQNDRVTEVGTVVKKKGDDTLTVHNNRTATIKEGNDTLTIEKGNRTTKVDKGDDALTVAKGDRAVKVSSGSISEEAGKKIDIEAGDQITLKTGQSTIVMKKDGTITIKGVKITVQGRQAVTLKSMKITLNAKMKVDIKAMQIGANAKLKMDLKALMINAQAQVKADLKGVMVGLQGSAMLKAQGGIAMIN